jgi:Ca2+/Na+ antiporter
MQMREAEEPLLTRLGKYFLHGILFSIAYLILTFLMVPVVAGLMVVGSVAGSIGILIGLILGLAILIFALAFVNAALTELVWSIPMKANPTSLLGHGIILFLGLLIANLPAIVVNVIMPDVFITIVVFVAYCFIDGYLAMSIATGWTAEESEESEEVGEIV